MWWRASISHSGYPFFGLSNDMKLIAKIRDVHMTEILELCMNSNGGITYYEAYHMPVSVRKYNLKKIIEKINAQNERIQKEKGQLSMKDIATKNFPIPDFVAKSPKKK